MKTRMGVLGICVLILAGVGWGVYEYSSSKAEKATERQKQLMEAQEEKTSSAGAVEEAEVTVMVTQLTIEKVKHDTQDAQGSEPFRLRVEISYRVSDSAIIQEPRALQFDVEYPDEYAVMVGSKTASGNSLYLAEGNDSKGSDVFYEGIIDADAGKSNIDRLLLSKKPFKVTIWVDGEIEGEQWVYNKPVDRGGIIAKAEYENEPETMQFYTKLFYQAMPNAELIGKILADMDGDKKEELIVIYRDTSYDTWSNVCVMREGQASGINLVPGSNRFQFAEGAASLRILEDPVRASIKLKDKQTGDIVYYELTIDINIKNESEINVQKIQE